MDFNPFAVVRTTLRTAALRLAMRGKSNPMDITTLHKIPEHLTYPLRRDGVDPVPALAEQRAIDPVHLLGSVLGLDIWLISGHAAAKQVLADSKSYSNDMRHLLGTRKRTDAEGIGGLGMTDAPDHTKLRGLLTPEFTMRRLRRLDDKIDQIVADALDAMEANGPVVDLVQKFGFEIPFRVICDLLGMDEDVRDEFHKLGAARFDLAESGAAGAFGAANETRAFLINEVKHQRQSPGEGLIGEIIRTRGDDFDDVELGGLADGVFLGGYETSAAMLSMGAYVLTQNPDGYAALRSGDKAQVDAVIEELLRYLCPVQIAFARFAREDHELFGHQVKKGAIVMVSLSGANRDPEVVPHPEQFDLRNIGTQNFAFGHGLHRCVGAELARMEMRTALVALAHRFPNLALATDDLSELGFAKLSIVYSVANLPVRLDSAHVEDSLSPMGH